MASKGLIGDSRLRVNLINFFYIYLGIKHVASHPRSRAMHGFSVLYDVMYYY